MASALHLQRRFYSDTPPPYQSRSEVNPTLLVSWWCTVFSLTIILIRVAGRWVRTERLFFEDKIMLFSVFPLFIRMGLVHVLLKYNTNNVITTGLSDLQLYHCEIGAKLVLASRIFYAAFIWVSKFAVLEFLKRTIGKAWAKSFELGLRSIYAFLIITFCGVVIATLSECQPFDHYWQVVPDPGPHCREGLVQLVVMGACDMVTDVALIVFPVPIIMSSALPLKKRLSMILLFLLSLILIAITAYRIPSTISRQSEQQYRSLLASLEILASTCVANAVVIGSFIRDKGVKKSRFRQSSVDNPTMESMSTSRARSVTMQHWGSDVDLALGMGTLPSELRHDSSRPAASGVIHDPQGSDDAANPINGIACTTTRSIAHSAWNFNQPPRSRRRRRRASSDTDSSNDSDYGSRKYRTRDPAPDDNSQDEAEALSGMHISDPGGLVERPEPSMSRDDSVTLGSMGRSISTLPHPFGRSSSRAFLSDLGVRMTRGRYSEELSDRNSHILEGNDNDSPRHSAFSRFLTRSPRPSRVERRPPELEDVDSFKLDEVEGESPEAPDTSRMSDGGGSLR